jgi:hypothetical protein
MRQRAIQRDIVHYLYYNIGERKIKEKTLVGKIKMGRDSHLFPEIDSSLPTDTKKGRPVYTHSG